MIVVQGYFMYFITPSHTSFLWVRRVDVACTLDIPLEMIRVWMRFEPVTCRHVNF